MSESSAPSDKIPVAADGAGMIERARAMFAPAIARHAWTAAIGLPFVISSYWLPLPRLPFGHVRLLRAAGLGASSLAFAAAWAIWRRRSIPWRATPRVIVTCALVQWFFDAFLRWKAAMPLFVPFWADPLLWRVSKALHGGHALYFQLAPALAVPTVLVVLDAIYYMWFPVMIGFILWEAWRADRQAAARFALAFVVVWVGLGICVAYAFSSVGPIFLKSLDGDPAYAPLLASLQGLPLTTTKVANELWHLHATLGVTEIAAFPSIHVAMPALYAAATRGWWRWFFATLTVVTWLGSVMLGWHYAIDGYAAVILALLSWRVASWAYRHREADPCPQA